MDFKEILSKLDAKGLKRFSLFTATVVLVSLVYLFCTSGSNFRQYLSDRRECKKIQKVTAEYNSRIDEFRQDVMDITSNLDSLEKVGRERYGLQCPDEVVYNLKY